MARPASHLCSPPSFSGARLSQSPCRARTMGMCAASPSGANGTNPLSSPAPHPLMFALPNLDRLSRSSRALGTENTCRYGLDDAPPAGVVTLARIFRDETSKLNIGLFSLGQKHCGSVRLEPVKLQEHGWLFGIVPHLLLERKVGPVAASIHSNISVPISTKLTAPEGLLLVKMGGGGRWELIG